MHFWIDKRSQGCGFNGRYLVPPSISASRRLLCGGVHPKLMVTPVHRFQSITNVSSGSVRHPRVPGHPSTRITLQCHAPVQINASSSANARNNAVNRSIDLLSTGRNTSVTPRNAANHNPSARLKCGVWVFFAILTFFIAGAKFYFHGGNIGMEALAFCSLMVVIILVGGLVSLYEAISSTSTSTRNVQHSVQISSEQNDTHEETSNQVPNNVSPLTVTELPPPPYHIAIMLPPAQADDNEDITILRDSPPPSYDKAVT